jgi:hypothetical protein
MLYLSGSDLFDLVSPQVLVAAVEEGLRDWTDMKWPCRRASM